MWELGPDADRPEWRTVESPFEKTIYEVVSTAAGPYAIGDGGTLLADRGDGWEIVLDDGPKTRDNQLRGMDVTADGKRVWFAGSSGALGCYDVEARRKYDYSSPNEMTSTWEGITVSGPAGSEKVLVANGSGEVLPFTVDGFDEDWEDVRKPAAKGSNVAALAASPDGVGYAVDTSGNAFRTTADDGWEDIGIVNAQVKFNDIYAGSEGRVYVAAGDGRIYRYDDSYNDWTPIGVAEETLHAFDIHGDQMVVIGAGGGIHQRTGRDRWEEVSSPVGVKLYDVALGDPDVIVGNSGTILERPRGEPRDAGASPDGDEYDGRGEYFDGDDAPPGESGDGSASGDGESGESANGGSSDGGSTDGDSSSGGSTDGGSASGGSSSDSSASGGSSDGSEGGS